MTNVKYFTNMFYGMIKLETIYAEIDFVRSSGSVSSNMFYNDTRLVGAAGTPYETSFTSVQSSVSNSSYMESGYEQIATDSQQGYFTYKQGLLQYHITYNLDGGTVTNSTGYTDHTETFTLNNPVKPGYTFIGWTGSNGIVPELTVTITQGTTGDLTYTANYTPNTFQVIFDANGRTGSMSNQTFTYGQDQNLNTNLFTREDYEFNGWNTEPDGSGTLFINEQEVSTLTTNATITLYAQWRSVIETFETVFEIDGECQFNGANGNITGTACGEYANYNYINTGLNLFDNDNYMLDFEIYMEISHYKANEQESGVGQQTFISSFQENSNGERNLGVIFRRSGNNIEILARNETSENRELLVLTRFEALEL